MRSRQSSIQCLQKFPLRSTRCYRRCSGSSRSSYPPRYHPRWHACQHQARRLPARTQNWLKLCQVSPSSRIPRIKHGKTHIVYNPNNGCASLSSLRQSMAFHSEHLIAAEAQGWCHKRVQMACKSCDLQPYRRVLSKLKPPSPSASRSFSPEERTPGVGTASPSRRLEVSEQAGEVRAS